MEYKIEPERKPAVNPFASEQIIRTIPEKGIVPLPIVGGQTEQKESAFVHNKIEFPEYNDGLLEEFDKQFFENGQEDDLTETALEQKDVK